MGLALAAQEEVEREAAVDRASAVSVETRVLEVLAPGDVEGTDRYGIMMQTGLSAAQVSAALGRLRKKGLAECARWRETSVWWKVEP